MKKLILLTLIVLSTMAVKSQVKLYNVDLPYFNKSKLVKSDKTVRNVNVWTKQLVNITEYNSMGQLHGVYIQYRSDVSVDFVRYYHNGRLVYLAQPFRNGSKIQTVYNYNDGGSYDGTQLTTIVNSETNKWEKIRFVYSNGRLSGIGDKLKFPKYTVNFKDGKLNGEFYFYDSASSCYYYGFADSGKIKNISKFDIREDLSFRNTFYTINENSIKSTYMVHYDKPRVSTIEISQNPVVVENKDVHLEDDKNRIVFGKQIDWMQALTSLESYNNSISDEEIDWSEASVPPPAPYYLPQKQH